jgi:hypothetical protein
MPPIATEFHPGREMTRCYIRDPDGYIIELGKATRASLTAKGSHHKLESRPNLPFNGFSNGL